MKTNDILNEFKEIKNDYDFTVPSRFVRKRTGLPVGGAGADYNWRSEFKYFEGVENARDMCRNDAIMNVMIERAVQNEIQEGFTLEVKTSDSGFNQAVADMWMDWATDPDMCDIAGEMCFSEFEMTASQSLKRDGDCLVVALESGELQFIENHLIRTNSKMENTVLGVHLDQYRKRLGYYVSEDPIDPFQIASLTSDQIYIPARNEHGMKQAFHIFDNSRVTETRGVTALAPIMKISAMLEDVNFAKLVQQQIASAIVILRSRSQFQGGMQNSVNYGEQGQETSPTGEILNTDGVQMGLELTSNPGEDISAFTSNVPNAEYFQQVELLLSMMSVNLGLPLCVMMLDASNTNYSGFRGAIEESRKGFRKNQNNLIKKFHDPCYKLKLSHFLAEDPALRKAATKMGKAAFKHVWTPRAFGYIDPKVEAEADAYQLRTGLTSPRRIQQKNGRRWEDVSQEIVEDNLGAIKIAKEQAKAINDEFVDGSPVTWRELMPLATPEGSQVGLITPTMPPEDQVEFNKIIPKEDQIGEHASSGGGESTGNEDGANG